MTDGKTTAFPLAFDIGGNAYTLGLSKREYFAAIALQGLLAADSFRTMDERVRKAVQAADALIAALNAEPHE